MTSTSKPMTDMIVLALEGAGYLCVREVDIGKRIHGGEHRVDVVANKVDEQPILVSLKWQQTIGTADEKVPYEAICLVEALVEGPLFYKAAYIVIAGPGWRPHIREWYTSGRMMKWLNHTDRVHCVTWDEFVSRLNRGAL